MDIVALPSLLISCSAPFFSAEHLSSTMLSVFFYGTWLSGPKQLSSHFSDKTYQLEFKTMLLSKLLANYVKFYYTEISVQQEASSLYTR